jgi:hypothetical protein
LQQEREAYTLDRTTIAIAKQETNAKIDGVGR